MEKRPICLDKLRYVTELYLTWIFLLQLFINNSFNIQHLQFGRFSYHVHSCHRLVQRIFAKWLDWLRCWQNWDESNEDVGGISMLVLGKSCSRKLINSMNFIRQHLQFTSSVWILCAYSLSPWRKSLNFGLELQWNRKTKFNVCLWKKNEFENKTINIWFYMFQSYWETVCDYIHDAFKLNL